jgi:hypothetical protein
MQLLIMRTPVFLNSSSKHASQTAKALQTKPATAFRAVPHPAVHVSRRLFVAGMLPAAAALLPMPWRWWSASDEGTAAQKEQDVRRLAEERRRAAERAALRDRMGRYIR